MNTDFMKPKLTNPRCICLLPVLGTLEGLSLENSLTLGKGNILITITNLPRMKIPKEFIKVSILILATWICGKLSGWTPPLKNLTVSKILTILSSHMTGQMLETDGHTANRKDWDKVLVYDIV